MILNSNLEEEGMIKNQLEKAATPIWIGIQGGTCAGKTTFANVLRDRLGCEQSAIICLDSFFKAYDRKANAANVTAYNFDHPSSLDWLALETAVISLSSGQPTCIAEFEYETGFLLKGQDIEPKKFMIIEGLWPFFYQPLFESLDLKVFLDTPSDLRLARLLLRNIVGESRGWTVRSVLDYYLECIRPMQVEYIDSGIKHADLIVSGEESFDASVERVIQALARIVSP